MRTLDRRAVLASAYPRDRRGPAAGDAEPLQRWSVGTTPPDPQKAGLQAPGLSTPDVIWYIVVIAFAVVMIGGAVALVAAIFSGNQPEMLLTVFTTAAGYLACLLSPSPVQAKGTSGKA